ncbi:MAG: 50S ribosome-binding GTPase [Candidatus Nanoarchaeia archaeon]|nr:50S ribosome-binding GTPase [Candidatus Nanoarchaeia archaeon]
MKRSFWDIVNKVIEQSDVLLEILDARFIDETRNPEIEDKVKKSGKQLIYVFNKCDLADTRVLEKKKKQFHPCVFVSSIKRYGITMLLHEIQKHADKPAKLSKFRGAETPREFRAKEKVIVGVLGYPNTGKSSVINALSGRSAALVSPQSGFTKAMQLIKVTKSIFLLDTPGVYSYMEKDFTKHAMRASLDFTRIRDPETTALFLIEGNKAAVSKQYNIKEGNSEKMLEEVALRLNKLKKGGILDTNQAARALLKDWQRGKINL